MLAGLAVLVRDGLLLIDTGRWLPLAIGDLRGWSEGVPELVLMLWITPPLILLGAALLVLCRREPQRRFRRRPS